MMIQIHNIYICLFSLAIAIASGHGHGNVHAFVLPASSPSPLEVRANKSAMASNTAIKAESDGSTSIVDTIQTSFRIAQESNAAGYGFKQILADVLAGDFDQDAVSQTIDETVVSAPCVMYTWESSPSCKKAIEAFQTIGAEPKIVRLDDPWEEGNLVRAALGRKVGRTSVPFVFVDGRYIGGFDGGLEGNPDAAGMVDLAFQGKLRDMLSEAGAMK